MDQSAREIEDEKKLCFNCTERFIKMEMKEFSNSKTCTRWIMMMMVGAIRSRQARIRK